MSELNVNRFMKPILTTRRDTRHHERAGRHADDHEHAKAAKARAVDQYAAGKRSNQIAKLHRSGVRGHHCAWLARRSTVPHQSTHGRMRGGSAEWRGLELVAGSPSSCATAIGSQRIGFV